MVEIENYDLARFMLTLQKACMGGLQTPAQTGHRGAICDRFVWFAANVFSIRSPTLRFVRRDCFVLLARQRFALLAASDLFYSLANASFCSPRLFRSIRSRTLRLARRESLVSSRRSAWLRLGEEGLRGGLADVGADRGAARLLQHAAAHAPHK